MTRRRHTLFPVLSAALGLFLVVFLLFALHARAVQRHAVASAARVAAVQPPRRVLQRRVIVRTVVVHLRPAGDDGPSVPVRVAIPAPASSVTTTATPPPAAPAAPAPAPSAPLVTRTS